MLLAKLEGTSNYKEYHGAIDVIRLLKAIKGQIFDFNKKTKTALSLYTAEENFFKFKQTREMSTP
eukprot:7250908-Ditylum_brightwellii.AAC.1